jgi:hypothetical protein
VSGRVLDCAPPWRVITPPPQGSSLGPGLWCPGPSSLNRPHPSHSLAHRDFTAWRLIRDAFAVRERLGDPRVVPGFRCSFPPDMPPSLTPGSSIIVSVQDRCRRWPSPWTKGLGTPENPAIRFTRGTDFGATLVRDCYGLSGCWPPCTDLTGLPANGGFYFQAFNGSVVLPAVGYDYNSDWTPLLAGLSPAGMAASLAALARPCSCPARRKVLRGIEKAHLRDGGVQLYTRTQTNIHGRRLHDRSRKFSIMPTRGLRGLRRWFCNF